MHSFEYVRSPKDDNEKVETRDNTKWDSVSVWICLRFSKRYCSSDNDGAPGRQTEVSEMM